MPPSSADVIGVFGENFAAVTAEQYERVVQTLRADPDVHIVISYVRAQPGGEGKTLALLIDNDTRFIRRDFLLNAKTTDNLQ